jgi:DNA-binding beta-propeller fold protein YncE
MVLDSGPAGSGALFVSDTACNNVRRVTVPGGAVTTIAGGSNVPTSMASGSGTSFRFNQPKGLAVSGGTLYVSDSNSHRVLRVTLATGAVSAALGLATFTSSPYGTEGAPGAASFNSPNGLAFDEGGNLLVLDQFGCRMRRALAGTFVASTIVGQNGSAVGAATVDGRGLAARLFYPGALAADTASYWLAQPWSYSIRRISRGTLDVTTIAGGTMGTTDGIGAAAKFSQPSGIATDLYGNVYVADASSSHAVRVLSCKACPAGLYCSSTGTTTTCPPGAYCPAGSSAPTPCAPGTFSPASGASAPCAHECPAGAYCPAGTSLPLACPPGWYGEAPGQGDAGACAPCAAAPGRACAAGSTDGAGTLCPPGSWCAGGAAPAQQCACPGLCAAPGGAAEVTSASPTVWSLATVAGAGAQGSADGVGTSASFSSPRGVAVAPDGTVVVADTQNSLLRRVYANATVDTWCGTRGAFAEADGGCAAGAVLYYAAAVAFTVSVLGWLAGWPGLAAVPRALGMPLAARNLRAPR